MIETYTNMFLKFYTQIKLEKNLMEAVPDPAPKPNLIKRMLNQRNRFSQQQKHKLKIMLRKAKPDTYLSILTICFLLMKQRIADLQDLFTKEILIVSWHYTMV